MNESLIRTIYLYLFSLIGLVIVVIGLVGLLDLALKVYVFTQADQHRATIPQKLEGEDLSGADRERIRIEQEITEEANIQSRRQSTASSSLAMIIVGLPLFLYHWRIISKNKKS